MTSALAFPGGPAWAGGRVGADDGDPWAYGILDTCALSLGGGTDEVQKNTLGDRVLGLPREPAVDRDVPFRDVQRNA